ncbi:MAG: hypothetical protein ACREMX_13165 [Gemmatimonadales bacterium]
MKRLLTLAALLLLGCAVVPRGTEAGPAPIQVLSHSNNRSEVDVYLLCGDRDARWLGVVSEKGAAAFEIPSVQVRCIQGLNFFLVVRRSGRGYWVGPLQPRGGAYIDLVIEKYAGLSTARLRSDLR